LEVQKKNIHMPYTIFKFLYKEVQREVLQKLHSNAIDPCVNRLFFMLNKNTNMRTGCKHKSARRLGTSLVKGVVKLEKSFPEHVMQAGQAV
jgi:hypothetical protein